MQGLLTNLLDYVGDVGWDNCAWSDDSLASKELTPGYRFGAKGQKWHSRLLVTNTAMALLHRRDANVQKATQKLSYRKPTRACM